jgi:predicted nucleic acid-binding protein
VIGVDASVAARWIFTEEYSEQARALLRAALSAGELIVAPPLLPIEVTNIIRQRMRQEALPLPEARQRLAAFLAIPVTLRAPRTLYRRALEIAEQHDLPRRL